jgi:hypothetical protein
MTVIFKSDGKRVEVQIVIVWRLLRAMLKALLPIIAALISFLAAPEIARLGSYIGW